MFKIKPLNLGELLGMELSRFTYERDWGEKVNAPVLAYLVQNGERNILVDTGMSSSYFARNYYEPLNKESEHEMDFILKSHGLEATDIDTVIWTHLHWDHCQNAELFKNATFFVQKKEIEYAMNPLPLHRRPYEVGGGGQQPEWIKMMDKIKVIDGNQEITKGIDVVVTPGHSPGFQSVSIKGYNDNYLIVGDTVPLKRNWDPNPAKYIPGGIHVDLKDCYFSHSQLLKYSDSSTFLYGHDYSILEKPVYE
ncbi:N-acyl homoserine lactonase family protein [Lysinibacillus capsici]|uniref:N-acyl homoserine lactonase family protein n=1 Tax=Lysinibacillus capsici TaxID=2115968 RepID=UPI0036BA67EB